jgi:hypothetical protein
MFLGAYLGCGSGAVNLPTLIPVNGKVTYKGQPLTEGTVRFEPDDGYGRMATGKLQSDGSFILSTYTDADGVVAGHHKVFITEPGKSLAKDRAFKKYTGAASSKQTADVTSEQHEFTFDLK